jgi:hypothetical protein
MFKSDLFNRLFGILFGITIILISLYAYRITSKRKLVLDSGQIVNTIITRTHSRGTNKTIFIKINEVEYSAGEAFGDYNRNVSGDSISVYYLKNIDYVVLQGKRTYFNTLIFEIAIMILGFFLIILGLLYSGKIKEKMLNWETKVKFLK